MHTAAAMTNIRPIMANLSIIMTTIHPITRTITTIPIQILTNIQTLIVNLVIHIIYLCTRPNYYIIVIVYAYLLYSIFIDKQCIHKIKSY